ncbi:unnamed protein product [Miscanthus lutarioriparius]|uniref:Uncharacterized protein n=1 Tax=Miscanthus lutarioriparius TaxID=422564 RepID=A0A811RIK6_9POAL|nr:unnamed protein product [Miscanthus lutarioriparius]
MAAVAEGSASAAAKEVEYQAGVQKLVDLLSKLNLAAKEFVPSAAVSPPKKALSANAPVFDCHSIRGRNGATDAAFYVGFGNQHRRVTEERLADIFATCGQVVDCRICGDPHSALRCFLLTPSFYLIWSTAMPAAFSEHYERPMD